MGGNSKCGEGQVSWGTAEASNPLGGEFLKDILGQYFYQSNYLTKHPCLRGFLVVLTTTNQRGFAGLPCQPHDKMDICHEIVSRLQGY